MMLWHDISHRFGLQGVRITVLCLALLLLGLVSMAARQAAAPAWFLSADGQGANQPIAPAPPPGQPKDPRYQALRHDIETQIASVPEFASFFDHFRRAFPIDYDLTLQRGIDRADVLGHVDAPEQYVLDAISVLRRGRGLLASRARDSFLIRVFDLQSQTMAALSQVDSHLCVGFLYGAAGAGFAEFAASHRALVADLASAGLEAVLDGQTSRMVRPAPSEADFQRIEGDLSARGIPSAQIDALLDGRMPTTPMPDADFCHAAVAYLEVLKALPATARMSIYALSVELMSRS